MGFVNDTELEASIRGMIIRLLDHDLASSIDFRLLDYKDPDFPFRMQVWFDGPSRHLIVIHSAAREMLSSKEGEEIVFAALAHEIGHVIDIRKIGFTGFYALGPHLQKAPAYLRKLIDPMLPHLQFFFGFWPQAECRADGYAAVFLARVYSNPTEVMARQARFALGNSLPKETSSCYSRFQARVFAWLRLRNLRRIELLQHQGNQEAIAL